MLVDVLHRLDALWDRPMPYMLWFHQRPFDGGSWPSAHVHVEIAVPQRAPGVLRFIAGGELGSGLYVNPVVPESAAAELRAVSMVNEQLRVWAPGRVNLIGGHSDYSGGLVLPMAIDLGTTIVGHRGHERVVLVSQDEPEPAEVALDVSDPAAVTPTWARYVAGVVAEVAPTTGFIGQVSTTIPIGTGLSSSAALEVAVALALVGDDRIDRQQLALACQRAEHRASGVPCGIMDQFASLLGVEGHAILIDCTTLDVTPVELPDDIAIVVVDSGQRRSLSTTGYADRRNGGGAGRRAARPARRWRR